MIELMEVNCTESHTGSRQDCLLDKSPICCQWAEQGENLWSRATITSNVQSFKFIINYWFNKFDECLL